LRASATPIGVELLARRPRPGGVGLTASTAGYPLASLSGCGNARFRSGVLRRHSNRCCVERLNIVRRSTLAKAKGVKAVVNPSTTARNLPDAVWQVSW